MTSTQPLVPRSACPLRNFLALVTVAPVDATQERVALGLAVISVVIGLMPLASFGLVQIGRLGVP